MKLENQLNLIKKEVGFEFDFPEVQFEELINTSHPCYSINEDAEIIGVNLSYLRLNEIPPIISKLETLQIIRLEGNEISGLPMSLKQLTNLTHIYLPTNQFTELPKVIPHITSLEVLALNRNQIKTLPPQIEDLQKLRKLGLSGNDFSILPNCIGELFALRSLFVEKNKLTEIPEWLANLTQLEEISVSSNFIGSLPPDFGKLSNLRILNLSRNNIKTLPASFFECRKLEDINLAELPINSISDDISNLTQLRNLNLSGTQIHDLPASFARFKKLTSLNMTGIKFGEIPPIIFRLTNLVELNLSGSRVRSISAEIGQLSKLKILDLSGMGLSSIPAVIFGMKNLERLNLVGNRLRELPPQITQSTLDICWKRGKIILNHRKEFNKKSGIFIYGNPLESPPIEIAQNGTKSIHLYFRSLKGERKSIDEVKVLLVGDGGAGKTSLAKRLIGRDDFDDNEPQTHGINIDDFNVLTPQGKRIKVHFWDFGGQEIMHATHQFFLSKRSAYILVLDGRKDEKTEYWLKHIEAFGGDSPVIIVINKIDQNPSFDLNRRFLMEKYPNIKGFFRVSCLTEEGVEVLQKGIASLLARIDHTKTLWGSNWLNVKERVELMPEDFISFSKFKEICIEEKIDEVEVL